jgi:peptidoglycan hydrolase-like protein with peptidoglycan-binding domain
MVTKIGRSTDPSTVNHRSDVSGENPASFRYCNPGAQYPSSRAARFGQTGYGIIGGGHKIARFPSPVNGAAANFDLLSSSYVGMKIGRAGEKWTGSYGFGVPAYDSNETLTREMVDNPVKAIALLKAIASRESGRGNNLSEFQWQQAHAMYKSGSADSFLDGLPAPPIVARPLDGTPSGAGLVERALKHLDEPYENELVPKDDPNWHGPWDCAEFVSWLVFQEAGILYGCVDNSAPPATVEAYTGAWKRDVERLGKRVSVEEAAATVGGIVLRYPPRPGRMGHIAVCDGKGGTIEAKGKRYGVVQDKVDGRGWHTGVLIPQLQYESGPPIRVLPPEAIYEVGAPNMDMGVVTLIQVALAARGFDPGDIDGEFGPNTEAAVIRFQTAEGLVIDGAVGPETASALDVPLTPAPRREIASPAGAATAPTSLPADAQGLLALLVAILSKEKPMGADTAKPGQNLELLLPLLLQAALSEKPLDLTQLLSILATGKPVTTTTPGPTTPSLPADTVPAPIAQGTTPGSQPSVDIISLLVPILYERLSGKPWPGTEQKPDTPTNPETPVVSKPSVQLSAGALGIATLLQALGIIGMPFGIQGGPEAPTQIGTLSSLIPIITGAIGATGGFSTLGAALTKLLGGLLGGAGKR